MFDKLRQTFSEFVAPRQANTSSNSIYRDDDDFWYAGPRGLAGAGGYPLLTQAQKLTSINACTRLLSFTGAMLPVTVKREVGDDGGFAIDKTNDIHRIFTTEPNEYQSPFEFKLDVYGGLVVHGNHISEVLRGRNFKVDQFWPIANSDVSVEWFDRKSGRRRMYDVFASHDGRPRVLADDQVWHPRLQSLNGGLTGASPIALNAAGINLALGSTNYANEFFNGGGKMAGFIAPDGDALTLPQQEALNKALNRPDEGKSQSRHSTYKIFGRPLKFHQVSVGPEDAQLVLMLDWTIADVARIWGVPLWLLQSALKERASGRSVEQEGIGFDTYTMAPFVTVIESSATRWLLPDGMYLDIEMNALKRADMKSVFESFGLCSNANRPWMKTNEMRRLLNMQPDDDPDSKRIVPAVNNTATSGAGGGSGETKPAKPSNGQRAQILHEVHKGDDAPCAMPE